MTIKITLEFKSVDEAIVALGKMVAAPQAAVTAKPAPHDTGSGSVAAATSRKGRSDKGQKRGEYKPRTSEAGNLPATLKPGETFNVEPGDGSIVVNAAPQGQPEAQAQKAQVTDQAVPAGAAPTIGDKDTEAQAVLESVLAKRGLNDALALLSRYGAKKLRDIPKSMRDEFMQHAKQVAAGGAI